MDQWTYTIIVRYIVDLYYNSMVSYYLKVLYTR